MVYMCAPKGMNKPCRRGKNVKSRSLCLNDTCRLPATEIELSVFSVYVKCPPSYLPAEQTTASCGFDIRQDAKNLQLCPWRTQ